jgi:hypothetical protein
LTKISSDPAGERKMAFAVETIPESEKARYPFINEKLSSAWVIDRERSAFMALAGTVGGPCEGTPVTDYYVLHWLGESIDIAASPQPKTFLKQGAVMNWRVRGVKLPPSLQGKVEEVHGLIRDAFAAVGQAFDGERFSSVSVEFDSPANK